MGKELVRPVFLSPHLDDVALSCGGFIWQQAQRGLRPIVVTVFAGVPDYHTLSPFAAELHRSWGLGRDPVAQRRCEDATAMSYLGAEYEHWDYVDCIYRRQAQTGEFLYASVPALYGELRGDEQKLVGELAARLLSALPREPTELYVPLAVGHHVDHQLVSLAGLHLRKKGLSVQFYEDFPYAESSENLADALGLWTVAPTPTVRALDERSLKAKTAAIGLYRSQLDMLFGGEEEMARRLSSYALAVGGGSSYGERYWQGGERRLSPHVPQ